MSDIGFAHELLTETFPVRAGRNVKACIGAAFSALRQHETALARDKPEVVADRERHWTERRVRSIWAKTARRIDHYEIEDLTAIAVGEARIERERNRARDARLEALIASSPAGGLRQVDQP